MVELVPTLKVNPEGTVIVAADDITMQLTIMSFGNAVVIDPEVGSNSFKSAACLIPSIGVTDETFAYSNICSLAFAIGVVNVTVTALAPATAADMFAQI